MTHQPYQDWLFDAPDDLSPGQRSGLQAHLSTCGDCRALADALRQVETGLREEAQSGLAPQEGFAARWQARLQADRQRAHRRQTLLVLLLSLGAALLLLGVMLAAAWPLLRTPDMVLWVGLYRAFALLSYWQGPGGVYPALQRAVTVAFPLAAWVLLMGIASELGVLWVVSYRLLTNPRRITQ
jgi:predicted anti-sigma-YlaC factor YlaD